MRKITTIPLIAKIGSIGIMLSGGIYLGWASILAPVILDYKNTVVEQKRIEEQRVFDKKQQKEVLKHKIMLETQRTKDRIAEQKRADAKRKIEIKQQQDFEVKQNKLLIDQLKAITKTREKVFNAQRIKPLELPTDSKKPSSKLPTNNTKFETKTRNSNDNNKAVLNTIPNTTVSAAPVLKTLLNVSEGETFDICGYKKFTVSSLDGNIYLKSRDRNIPDRKYRGYEKIFSEDVPLILWKNCILAVSMTDTLGTIRYTISSTKIN